MSQSVLSTKQPAGIVVCCLTEMWERFGFYVVQSLLILYMVHAFGFADSVGYAILGTFSAFAYISPIAGGYIADRVLGYRHSVIFGGVLFCIGYGLLAVPSESYFYYGLAAIIVGNGFFKPNISTFLGTLYNERDPRRERGFTIFYVGINVGSGLAAFSSGYIVRFFGWNASFLCASVGLFLGLCTFGFGLAYLTQKRLLHIYHRRALDDMKRHLVLCVYAGSVILVLILSQLLSYAQLSHWVLGCSAIVILAILFFVAMRSRGDDRAKMLACILLTCVSIVFWGLFFEIFYAFNLFVDRLVDRTFMGHSLPTPIFISAESLFILTLGPVAAWAWMRLEIKKRNPSIPMKFALSLLFMAIGFFFIWLGIQFALGGGLVNKWWVVLSYFFITIAELLLSPIGLAMMTELSPRHWVGMMMGVWFMSLGYGGKLAGWLASFAVIPRGVNKPVAMLTIYSHATVLYMGIALLTFVVILSLAPTINRLTRGDIS